MDDEGKMRRQWRPVMNTERIVSRSVAGFPCRRSVQESPVQYGSVNTITHSSVSLCGANASSEEPGSATSGRAMQPGLAGSCRVADCGVPSRPM